MSRNGPDPILTPERLASAFKLKVPAAPQAGSTGGRAGRSPKRSGKARGVRAAAGVLVVVVGGCVAVLVTAARHTPRVAGTGAVLEDGGAMAEAPARAPTPGAAVVTDTVPTKEAEARAGGTVRESSAPVPIAPIVVADVAPPTAPATPAPVTVDEERAREAIRAALNGTQTAARRLVTAFEAIEVPRLGDPVAAAAHARASADLLAAQEAKIREDAHIAAELAARREAEAAAEARARQERLATETKAEEEARAAQIAKAAEEQRQQALARAAAERKAVEQAKPLEVTHDAAAAESAGVATVVAAAAPEPAGPRLVAKDAMALARETHEARMAARARASAEAKALNLARAAAAAHARVDEQAQTAADAAAEDNVGKLGAAADEVRTDGSPAPAGQPRSSGIVPVRPYVPSNERGYQTDDRSSQRESYYSYRLPEDAEVGLADEDARSEGESRRDVTAAPAPVVMPRGSDVIGRRVDRRAR